MKKIVLILVLFSILSLLLGTNIVASDWNTSVFVDEFGDATENKYIVYKTQGLFSNSATSNSKCFINFIINPREETVYHSLNRPLGVSKWVYDKKKEGFFKEIVPYVGIFIHEYDLNNPIVCFIKGGVLKMKNSSDEIMIVRDLERWRQEGGIFVPDGWSTIVVEFLRKSIGNVKVAIHDNNFSTYKFTINTDGFTEAYNNLN